MCTTVFEATRAVLLAEIAYARRVAGSSQPAQRNYSRNRKVEIAHAAGVHFRELDAAFKGEVVSDDVWKRITAVLAPAASEGRLAL